MGCMPACTLQLSVSAVFLIVVDVHDHACHDAEKCGEKQRVVVAVGQKEAYRLQQYAGECKQKPDVFYVFSHLYCQFAGKITKNIW